MTAADKLAEDVRRWIDERMAGYTDAQYGKGELRSSLAAYEREKAWQSTGHRRVETPYGWQCGNCGLMLNESTTDDCDP